MSASGPPVNLTGQDHNVLFQAYCLNPPLDSCEFGPCPNSDVTGIGQMISLYTTGVTYSIYFFFDPENIRMPSYAYLVNIYSLFLAAITSFKNRQLTSNNAVYILLAIGSPSSIYLWTLSGYILLRKLVRSPVQHASYGIETQSTLELLALLSLGSFILYCTLAGMVAVPAFSSNFSQPACNKVYGRDKLWTMLWLSGMLIQLVTIVVALAFVPESMRGCIWRTRQQPPLFRRTSQDIIRWSRSSMKRCFPTFGTRGMISALILLIQASGLLGLVLSWTVPPSSFSALSSLPGITILWWSVSHRKKPTASRLRHVVTTSIFVTSLAAVTSLASFFPIFLQSPPQFQYAWWFCTWASVSQPPSSLVSETSFRRLSRIEKLFAVYGHLLEGIRPAYVLTFSSFVVIPSTLWIFATLEIVLVSPLDTETWNFGQSFAMIVAVVNLLPLLLIVKANWRAILKANWDTEEPTEEDVLDHACSTMIPDAIKLPVTAEDAKATGVITSQASHPHAIPKDRSMTW